MTAVDLPASMEHFHPRCLRAVLWIALLAGTLSAQTTTSSRGESFIIDHWTVNNGLPQNTVASVIQTSDGFLWLGTNGGLVRFDGVYFQSFTMSEGGEGRAYRITALVEGLDSTLWIGTEDGQLFRYRHGQFSPMIDPTQREQLRPVQGIGVDSTGIIWLGRSNLGLARVGPHMSSADSLVPSALQPDWPAAGVTAVHAAADGSLWIGGAGVAQLLGSGIRSYALPGIPNEDRVASLQKGDDGVVWAATSGHRLFRRSGDRFIEVPTATLPEQLTFDQALAPGKPEIHVAVRSGILRFLNGRFVRVGTPEWQQALRIRSVLIDREGNIWIGSDADGLLKIRRSTFDHWTFGDRRRNITSMAYDRGRGVWVGVNCGGVQLVRNGSVIPHPVSELFGDQCVWSVFLDSSGDLWVGTWGAGLWRLDPDRPAATLRRYGTSNGLKSDVVLSLAPQRNGRGMWVGTHSAGLALISRDRIQHWSVEEGLPSEDVRAFSEDSLGRLWIGTQRGPAILEDGRVRALDDGSGRLSVPVRVVAPGLRGSIWFGTYGSGLIRWSAGKASFITTREGLFDNIVSQFMMDAQGYVWMGCNRGIWKVAFQELRAVAEGRIEQATSISYGTQDGLQTIETNGGFQPSGLQLPNGELWFPTPMGIARTNPAAVPPNRTKPPVVINRVVVDGTPQLAASTVMIPSGVEEVRIEYTALSYTAPHKVRFKYQLVGYNKSWVDVQGDRHASFTNVTPGTYRFRVIAANNDGVWNEDGAELTLMFDLPYWQTLWFRVLAVLALVGMGMLVVAIRLRQVRIEKERQEETSRRLIQSQEEERQRIAGELHDSLGQDLIVAKNRLLLAAHYLQDGTPAKEELMNVVDAVTASLRSVRSIAYNLRPFQLDRLGLTETIRSTVRAVQQVTPVKIETEIATVDGLLNREAEIGVFRIVQEALTNVVKHSQATRASVIVAYDEGHIVIRVEDNGRGFDATAEGSAATMGFGLSSIEERVKMLGGVHKFSSSIDRGTTIAARIPVERNEPEPAP
jgi:signal transduction histidine kinase/ligand-binding sensor domain-containing protein